MEPMNEKKHADGQSRLTDRLGTRSFQSTHFVLQLSSALLIQLNGTEKTAVTRGISTCG